MKRSLLLVGVLMLVVTVAPARAGTPIAARPACAHSYLYWMVGASRTDYRDAMLCLINGARRAQGLPALKRSGPLESVAQSQSDRFAKTGRASHGASLADIGKRFSRKGYRPAAYDEGFAVLQGAASPYAFLADVVRRSGVPCTQILDPRFRDAGIGVSAGAGGQVTTLAIELGRRAGTSQPSSRTKPAATCGHQVPAPLVTGFAIEGTGTPAATDTAVTVQLACRAKVACDLTAAAQLPDAHATSPAQSLTIPAGQTKTITFPFDARALTAERAAAQPRVSVAVTVTAPAEYADTLTARLP